MNIRTVILVTGMHDNPSRERVVSALETVPGVQEVDVSLYRARAAVIHSPTCDASTLVRAIAHAGFEAMALLGSTQSSPAPTRRPA